MPLPIQDNELPNYEVDPKAAITTGKPQESNNIDEYAFLLQNLKEQVKMEIKDELYKSITLKANSLMSVDPATSTALMGVAAAITGAVSQMTPVDMSGGEPSNEDPSAPSGTQGPDIQPPAPPVKASPFKPSDKPASTDIKPKPPAGNKPPAGDKPKPPVKTATDFIFDTTIKYLKNKNYFELNKEAAGEEELTEDLTKTIGYINHGANIYAYNNDIDFSDTNSWDLLEELINDGTLYRTGYNDIIN